MAVNEESSTQQEQTHDEISLLSTKFYMPPARPTWVVRSRLLRRLDRGMGLGHRLGLITAPAGYGKTTLAAAWLDTNRPDTPALTHRAWLSLDETDNEPQRFFAYVLAALRRSGLDVGRRSEDWLRRGPSSLAELGPILIEDLGQALNSSAAAPVLVLDDYHRIQNPLLHEIVAFVLEYLPAPFHLLLLTREDPLLPLARWRVQNQMTEIRAKDLRFTVDETAEFLNRMMSLDLPAESIAMLEQRTEGWIAGLQLAALSLQDQADSERFVQNFAGDHRQVVDYLASEVLAKQPQEMQRFLLHTSILERMCADLCAAVLAPGAPLPFPQTPDTNYQALLEKLERRNLFLVPLDSRRHWYRYHHLFAELLRHHLHSAVDVETISELHRRAARWYAEDNQPVEAVEHALAAEDVNLAAELIEQALATGVTWSGGEVGTWQAWWQALPERALHSRPWLSLRISRALYLAGHIDEAKSLLDEVEQMLHESPRSVDEAAGLLAQATVYRAAIAAMRGDIRRAIQDAHRALNRLPERETLVRARAYDTLGMAYELRGEVEEANWAYLEAATLAQKAGVLYLVINARCEAAMVQIAQGQLQRAQQTCRSVIDEFIPDNADLPPLGLAWSVIGEILREQNQLQEAEQALHRGLQLSQEGGITDDLRHEYLFCTRLRLSQGDYEAGLAALQQADLLFQGYHVQRLSNLATAHRVRIWLAQGQDELALRWAEEYAQVEPVEYLREYEDLTLARVWLATDRCPEAVALLERLLAAAETAGRMGSVVEALALLALAHQAQEDEDNALDALERALTLAAPQGYARVFLDEGEPMLRLLYQVTGKHTTDTHVSDYAGALLAMSSKLPEQTDQSPSPSVHVSEDEQPLIEPLTERELEVLTLLAERLTNAEIGQRLVISVPTVKSHTSNIYAKLGVSSRRDAVAQAKTLGILA